MTGGLINIDGHAATFEQPARGAGRARKKRFSGAKSALSQSGVVAYRDADRVDHLGIINRLPRDHLGFASTAVLLL